ncbi:hypothetical protein H7X87_02745 [Acetobacteraceae bacterium]|nr:hypothetical protein [Candidatus Parcubacteria bacterium]
MNGFFKGDFFKFFFGFAAIIAVAFGVLIATSAFAPLDPDAVPNVAHPDDY